MHWTHRDAVATDIVHQHSGRLDYYKGCDVFSTARSKYSDVDWLIHTRNFTQFYSTKSDRDLNARKEYDNQMDYRKHLQAFIDRWRYNANRGVSELSFTLLLYSRRGSLVQRRRPSRESRFSKKWASTFRLQTPGTNISISYPTWKLLRKTKLKTSSGNQFLSMQLTTKYRVQVPRNREDITALIANVRSHIRVYA